MGRGISATATAVARGEATAAELCAAALERAAAAPGVFWSLDRDRAREQAADVDQWVGAGGEPGRLAGVPVAVKDGFDVAGLPTTGGLASPLHRPSADAAAVAALRRAGAVVVGKTAMDQLAWSMSGEPPGHPPCESPAAPGHVAGGSSGGSAAAVAAGIVPFAIGTDSAGSVRVPAAWCGVVGLKLAPGGGRLDGCLPLAPSVDSLGLFAGSAADCRLGLAALSGEPAAGDPAGRPLRLGVLVDAFAGIGDAEVESAYAGALAALGGAEVEAATVAGTVSARGFGVVLASEFAASWSGRLEGRPDVLPEVAEGIARGEAVTAARLAEARASVAAAELEARRLLEGFDALVLPTSPLLPAPIGSPPALATGTAFTRPFSAYGWAALSLPCGRARGLPIGLQLAAPAGAEGDLLAAAERLEKALSKA